MEILLVLVVGTLNVACFFIGAKVGQKVVKGEPIEIPSYNPLEVIREARDKKEADREQNKLDTIMQNLETYDGTGNGQKDVM
jgi:hypothetical protein